MINEGLQEGDLKSTVLPLISIDEYEGKIEKDNIVVAFYCFDKLSARDLDGFIQRTSIPIFDADISNSPTVQGYYLVFVEFERNKGFVKNIHDLLDEVHNLAKIKKWKFRALKHDGLVIYSKENIEKYIRMVNKDEEVENITLKKESITTFFRKSILEELEFDDTYLKLKKGTIVKEYRIVDFDNADTIFESLSNKPINLSGLKEIKILESILGMGWTIFMIENNIVLSRNGTNKAMSLMVI